MVPDEPQELCMDRLGQGRKRGEAEAEERVDCPKPVGRLQCLLGCLRPSDSSQPTHAAGLGRTGEPRSFRELDLEEPAASTLVGGMSQRGGSLRGRQLSETVEGDPAGRVGRLRRGGGIAPEEARQEEVGEEVDAKEAAPGPPTPPWVGAHCPLVGPPARGAANSGRGHPGMAACLPGRGPLEA